MTKNPSWRLPEVFVLIIPQVIRIHFSEWEVVVVCRPRARRGVMTSALKIPQMIETHFSDWEEVVARRGVKILQDIDILANYMV